MKATRILQAGSGPREAPEVAGPPEQPGGKAARVVPVDASGKSAGRDLDYPSRAKVRLEVIFLAAIWILAAALIWYGSSLTLWRDGSIGPGAYPLASLGGLLVLATVLLAKALRARELRLYSPFQPGLEDDLQLRQLASAMTQATGIPLRVVTKDGEGRFSSLWKGLRDSRTGDVLTVVSSDMTMLPNFHAAAFCSDRLEPIGGLFFDPDVLVVRSESDHTTPADLQSGNEPVRLGFGHHADVDHAVDRWLSATAPFRFTPIYSDDAAGLVTLLRNGELDALTLGLSQCQEALAAGELRCIGVFSNHEPPRAAANASSLSGHGRAVFSGRWAALMVPAAMAAERKIALSDAFRKAMQRLAPDEGTDTSARDWQCLSATQMKEIIATQQRCLSEISPEEAHRAMPTGKSAGLAFAIGGLAIFPAVMSVLGFPVTAFVFLGSLMLLLCPRVTAWRIVTSIAVAAIVTLAVHMIFTRVFGVVMPDPTLLGGIAWPIF